MKSTFGKLYLNDFFKGAITAVLVAVLTVLLSVIQDSGFAGIDWNLVLQTGSTAFIAYLLKNLGTNSRDEFGKKE